MGDSTPGQPAGPRSPAVRSIPSTDRCRPAVARKTQLQGGRPGRRFDMEKEEGGNPMDSGDRPVASYGDPFGQQVASVCHFVLA